MNYKLGDIVTVVHESTLIHGVPLYALERGDHWIIQYSNYLGEPQLTPTIPGMRICRLVHMSGLKLITIFDTELEEYFRPYEA